MSQTLAKVKRLALRLPAISCQLVDPVARWHRADPERWNMMKYDEIWWNMMKYETWLTWLICTCNRLQQCRQTSFGCKMFQLCCHRATATRHVALLCGLKPMESFTTHGSNKHTGNHKLAQSQVTWLAWQLEPSCWYLACPQCPPCFSTGSSHRKALRLTSNGAMNRTHWDCPAPAGI